MMTEKAVSTGAYPLEGKIRDLVDRAEQTSCRPTGINREFYLDLAEPVVRLAATWQDSRGIIEDPYMHRECEPTERKKTGIKVDASGFTVTLSGHSYKTEVLDPSEKSCRRLGVEAANRNGIYDVGIIEHEGNKMCLRLRLC